MPESIAMIAAIVHCFDLVSIVELCEDLVDLHRVLKVLGPNWQAVYSDYLRDAAGNRERIGFVFNAQRVRFTGLASCAEGARRPRGDGYVQAVPWWRPPFVASFATAKFEFAVIAAHVRWGSSASARRTELAALGDWVVARSKEPYFGTRDIVLAGDFNATASTSLEPLTTRGLVVPMRGDVTTDLARAKRYDGIASLGNSSLTFTGRTGALDFYCGTARALLPNAKLTKEAFTFQLSDHLPLWAECG